MKIRKYKILFILFLMGIVFFGIYNIQNKVTQQEQIKENIKNYVSQFNDNNFIFKDLTRIDIGLNENKEIKTCPYQTKVGSECVLSKSEDEDYFVLQEYTNKHGEKTPTDYYIVIFEHVKGKAEAMLMKRN